MGVDKYILLLFLLFIRKCLEASLCVCVSITICVYPLQLIQISDSGKKLMVCLQFNKHSFISVLSTRFWLLKWRRVGGGINSNHGNSHH